jgi:hypothetical protein
MLSCPQQIFDICWRFDPEAVLAPSSKPFMLTDPGFEVRTQANLPNFMASGKWTILSPEALRERASYPRVYQATGERRLSLAILTVFVKEPPSGGQ